jgi:hypothetical protein
MELGDLEQHLMLSVILYTLVVAVQMVLEIVEVEVVVPDQLDQVVVQPEQLLVRVLVSLVEMVVQV